MASKEIPVGGALRANVAQRVAVRVEDALKRETLVESGAVEIAARIAGAAAAVVGGLTETARRQLNKREGELIRRIRGLLESLSAERGDRIDLSLPRKVEAGKGAGLGEVMSEAEGRRALGQYATEKRLEDWAGPIAGATELSRDHGVPRSTLNHWQHAGAVIGLLKGTRKHVYPLAQFVDGRPAKGIAEVNAVAPSPRVAWLWLSRANPVLGGKKPIDLLKRDDVGEVVEAARAHFDQH